MGLRVLNTLIALLLLMTATFAQKKKYYLDIHIPTDGKKGLEKISYRKLWDDSLSVVNESIRVLSLLQGRSYLLARIYQRRWQGDTLEVLIRTGTPYYWQKIDVQNLDPSLLASTGFKTKKFGSGLFRWQELEQFKQQILEYSENNGFPFASVQMDSIRIDSNRISATISYQTGPKMVFDTLQISGDLTISQKFLARYLNIEKNQVFSQWKVDQSFRLLKMLPYIRIEQKPQVTFDSARAFVRLFLNKNRANRIDGIVGVLPNENPNRQSKTLITGEFNLSLNNLFQSGKTFKARWQRQQIATQLLQINYYHPFFLKSRLDFEIALDLLKQDSTFLNVDWQAKLYYRLNNTGKFLFKAGLKSSGLLGESLLGPSPSMTDNRLPEVSTARYLSLGLGYEWNNLDDLLYPRRGTFFTLQFSFGNKKIEKSPLLPDSLYAGVQLNSNQTLVQGELSRYFQLSRRSVIYSRLQLGTILNPNLFRNDLFRTGGLNSLRGHNQNIFFASAYAITTLEYRLFLEKESYIFLFYDQGWQELGLFNLPKQSDFPLGLGAGLSFSTGGGIFSLIYALGQSSKQAVQSLAVNRAKIHFGWISRF